MGISWYDCPCPISGHLIWYELWFWLKENNFEGLTTFMVNVVWSKNALTTWIKMSFFPLSMESISEWRYYLLDVLYVLAWTICFNIASPKHMCLPMEMQVRDLTWWKAEHLSRLKLGSWDYCLTVPKCIIISLCYLWITRDFKSSKTNPVMLSVSSTFPRGWIVARGCCTIL